MNYLTDHTWKQLLAPGQAHYWPTSRSCTTSSDPSQPGSPDTSAAVGLGPFEQPSPPPDTKFVAVTRGLQLTGILLCLANGKDLTRCQCFVELALNETKDA